jgi:hypothetical protein
VVSEDQRLLAVWLFSGQSQQGWELFELEPELRRIGGLSPKTYGMGDPPRFSPSGRWLAMFVIASARCRGSGEYFETVQDEYADDRVIVDWASLYVQRTSDGALEPHAVGCDIPRALDVEVVAEWDTYSRLRFLDDDRVELEMPWLGPKLVVELPVREAITARWG